MKKKRTQRTCIRAGVLFGAIIVVLVVMYIVQSLGNRISEKITVEEAQQIIDARLAELPEPVSSGAKFIAENSKVTVKDLDYGNERNLVITCDYETMNAGDVVRANIERYLTSVYEFYLDNTEKGVKTNATKVKLTLAADVEEDLRKAEKLTGEIELELYETAPGEYTLYLDDTVVNTVFGGILDARDIIGAADSVQYNGETISITNQNTLRTGIRDCITLRNYSSAKPDTAIPLERLWNTFKYDFNRNFVVQNRYMYIVNGLLTTLAITLCAVVIGIVLGFIVAIIRCTNQKTGKLEIADDICQIYLALMRGTPVMVQLLIMYFVILLPMGVGKFISAVVCFGLNSGAYVSEIVRGGIMSIDEGQTEAGRSLGFSYMKTMYYIVIPQAFKAVLPSLANEFIALLKETSVAFYIGVADLTLGGLKIRSITYSNFMPLIAIAVCYLVVVLGLSKCVSILERRLRKGDRS